MKKPSTLSSRPQNTMTESRLLAIETLTGVTNLISKEILHLMQLLANCYVGTKRYDDLLEEINFQQSELNDKLDKLLIEIERGRVK